MRARMRKGQRLLLISDCKPEANMLKSWHEKIALVAGYGQETRQGKRTFRDELMLDFTSAEVYVFVGMYDGIPDTVKLFFSKKQAYEEYEKWTGHAYKSDHMPHGDVHWEGTDLFEANLVR